MQKLDEFWSSMLGSDDSIEKEKTHHLAAKRLMREMDRKDPGIFLPFFQESGSEQPKSNKSKRARRKA